MTITTPHPTKSFLSEYDLKETKKYEKPNESLNKEEHKTCHTKSFDPYFCPAFHVVSIV